MTNHQAPIKKYPLLPFSQLVYNMTRWMPGVYHFPITYRWVNGAKEKERIEQSIRSALANHPVFQMCTDRHGLHYAKPLDDIFHGPFHDVNITVEGEDVLILAQFSRILGDGKSGEILIEDIRRAYEGLPLESDDYWNYLEQYEQRKSDPHYRISQEWLAKEFEDETVPVRPTIDRPLWTLFPPKAGLFKIDFADLHEQINHLKDDQFISYEGIFSLCAALAIAEYCGTHNAALTWAYEGRETEMEQRIFGSLHRDIPFQIKNLKSPISNLKSDLIREARNQIRSGIAHSDYPYTLTAPYNKRWDYAVNVLRVPEIENNPKYAYALLDIEIHESEERLELWFRYSATHYKESSIRHFAALVRKYVEWLLEE